MEPFYLYYTENKCTNFLLNFGNPARLYIPEQHSSIHSKDEEMNFFQNVGKYVFSIFNTLKKKRGMQNPVRTAQ
jgi:hypothetical protein